MLDNLNYIISIIVLLFFLTKVIYKFKPCLNIILLSIFLITVSMNKLNYLLASSVVIVLFYYFVPKEVTEGFNAKETTYHIIDNPKSILIDPDDVDDKVKNEQELATLNELKDYRIKSWEKIEGKFKVYNIPLINDLQLIYANSVVMGAGQVFGAESVFKQN